LSLPALPLAMRGPHQAANAAVALAAVCELRRQNWCISTEAMREGLSRAVLRGRVELIAGIPPVVLDVAHNPASARALVAALAEMPRPTRRTLILSISRDKDVRAIAAELVPHFDRIIVTQYRENPRAVPADQLADIAKEWSTSVSLQPQPANALAHARETARPGELVCIAGSFFLAAELRPHVLAGLVRGQV
jgi:dihydrofolate synthase/folylpolyglutamate synthase